MSRPSWSNNAGDWLKKQYISNDGIEPQTTTQIRVEAVENYGDF
jgi:hypothetical protein